MNLTQASQFLIEMANEVKSIECKQYSEQNRFVDGIADNKASPAFEPMRRKLFVPKEGER